MNPLKLLHKNPRETDPHDLHKLKREHRTIVNSGGSDPHIFWVQLRSCALWVSSGKSTDWPVPLARGIFSKILDSKYINDVIKHYNV